MGEQRCCCCCSLGAGVLTTAVLSTLVGFMQFGMGLTRLTFPPDQHYNTTTSDSSFTSSADDAFLAVVSVQGALAAVMGAVLAVSCIKELSKGVLGYYYWSCLNVMVTTAIVVWMFMDLLPESDASYDQLYIIYGLFSVIWIVLNVYLTFIVAKCHKLMISRPPLVPSQRSSHPNSNPNRTHTNPTHTNPTQTNPHSGFQAQPVLYNPYNQPGLYSQPMVYGQPGYYNPYNQPGLYGQQPMVYGQPGVHNQPFTLPQPGTNNQPNEINQRSKNNNVSINEAGSQPGNPNQHVNMNTTSAENDEPPPYSP